MNGRKQIWFIAVVGIVLMMVFSGGTAETQATPANKGPIRESLDIINTIRQLRLEISQLRDRVGAAEVMAAQTQDDQLSSGLDSGRIVTIEGGGQIEGLIEPASSETFVVQEMAGVEAECDDGSCGIVLLSGSHSSNANRGIWYPGKRIIQNRRSSGNVRSSGGWYPGKLLFQRVRANRAAGRGIFRGRRC